MPLDTLSARAFADLPNRAAAAHILDGLADGEFPEPCGWNVLVLQYVTPERKGGLIMPVQVQREDEFQGCVGIVLRLGPEAYKDQRKFPRGPWVAAGDWVAWPRLKGAVTRMAIVHGSHKAVLTVLADDAFVATGIDPERLSV